MKMKGPNLISLNLITTHKRKASRNHRVIKNKKIEGKRISTKNQKLGAMNAQSQ